jgi:hypothetical protein
MAVEYKFCYEVVFYVELQNLLGKIPVATA